MSPVAKPFPAEWAASHSESLADQVERARRRRPIAGRVVLGVIRSLACLGALMGGGR